MKSLEELKVLREKTLTDRYLTADRKGGRVVVGMATCGQAAGARPVLAKFQESVKENGCENIIVSQTGCIGVCRLEPMVEVYLPGHSKVTYVKMTADKVDRIVKEHILGGQPVEEYTIGYYEDHK